MNADKKNINELTETVIGAVIEVSNTLGAGFLEKVYERALLRELSIRGAKAAAQPKFSVLYKGRNVGDYCPDLIVEDELLVELKCVEHLCQEHMAQCLNYLRASNRHLCLLVNFHRAKVEWKRVALNL